MKICQRDSKKDDKTDNDNNDKSDSLFVAHDLNAIVGPETNGRGAPFDRVVVLKNNIDDDLVDDHDDHDLGDEDDDDHNGDEDDATHVLTGVHDQLSFDGPHPVLLVLKRRQNSNIVSSSPKLASKAAIIPPPPPAASPPHLTNRQKITCG